MGMAIRAGARADATDLALPDEVTATGNGTNTVTATAFAALPTTTCSAQMVNPHPTASLDVRVSFSAIVSTSGAKLWVCPAVTGSTSVSAGAGGGGAAGLAELISTAAAAAVSAHSDFTVTIPASANAAVFTMQAYRESATGTQQCDHPTLRLTPLRFVF